jgi:prepilin-type processing-associated H-X9-DG protein
MLSENIHKNANYCWLGVPEGGLGEQHFGMVWVSPPDPKVNYQPANGIYQVDPTPSGLGDFSIRVQEPISKESGAEFRDNAPRFARPASNHPTGIVNVVFVDGHGDAIEPAVDYVVYQQLLSAKGRNSTDPVNPPGLAIQVYQNAPPLSENSY